MCVCVCVCDSWIYIEECHNEIYQNKLINSDNIEDTIVNYWGWSFTDWLLKIDLFWSSVKIKWISGNNLSLQYAIRRQIISTYYQPPVTNKRSITTWNWLVSNWWHFLLLLFYHHYYFYPALPYQSYIWLSLVSTAVLPRGLSNSKLIPPFQHLIATDINNILIYM